MKKYILLSILFLFCFVRFILAKMKCIISGHEKKIDFGKLTMVIYCSRCGKIFEILKREKINDRKK